MTAEQLEKAISLVIMLSAVYIFRSKKAENPTQQFLGMPANKFLLLMYIGLAIAAVLFAASFF